MSKPINMATGGLMSKPPYLRPNDESDKEIRASDGNLKREPAGITPYDVNSPASARKGLPSRLLSPSRTRFSKGDGVKPLLPEDIPELEQHELEPGDTKIAGLTKNDIKLINYATKHGLKKVKEIREVVCQLEKELAANVIDPEDKDFWSKVQVLQPNNNKFWDKILLKCSNDPLYLDPVKDPFDLIKLYAVEAGGFSIVAKSLEDAKSSGSRFYLDRVRETTGTRTKLSKIRNRALASLQNLFDTDTTKLLYVTKVIHSNSTEYLHSTPVDVLYEEIL